jgi:hypothetical protein
MRPHCIDITIAKDTGSMNLLKEPYERMFYTVFTRRGWRMFYVKPFSTFLNQFPEGGLA